MWRSLKRAETSVALVALKCVHVLKCTNATRSSRVYRHARLQNRRRWSGQRAEPEPEPDSLQHRHPAAGAEEEARPLHPGCSSRHHYPEDTQHGGSHGLRHLQARSVWRGPDGGRGARATEASDTELNTRRAQRLRDVSFKGQKTPSSENVSVPSALNDLFGRWSLTNKTVSAHFLF